MDNEFERISPEEANDLAIRLLTAGGLSSGHVETIAASVVAAQLDECHSHGLYRIAGCVRGCEQRIRHARVRAEIAQRQMVAMRLDPAAAWGMCLLQLPRGRRDARAHIVIGPQGKKEIMRHDGIAGAAAACSTTPPDAGSLRPRP